MRRGAQIRVFAISLLIGPLVAGCRSTEDIGEDDGPLVAVPVEERIEGTIVRVDSRRRFVVIDFSVFQFPARGQDLNVYREQLRVGKVRITGPFVNTHIAADLILGSAREGDSVRIQ